MKEFTIAVEETLVQEFKVMADSTEDAINITEKKYKDGELVLESGEVQFRHMAVLSPCEEEIEWIEF